MTTGLIDIVRAFQIRELGQHQVDPAFDDGLPEKPLREAPEPRVWGSGLFHASTRGRELTSASRVVILVPAVVLAVVEGVIPSPAS